MNCHAFSASWQWTGAHQNCLHSTAGHHASAIKCIPNITGKVYNPAGTWRRINVDATSRYDCLDIMYPLSTLVIVPVGTWKRRWYDVVSFVVPVCIRAPSLVRADRVGPLTTRSTRDTCEISTFCLWDAHVVSRNTPFLAHLWWRISALQAIYSWKGRRSLLKKCKIMLGRMN